MTENTASVLDTSSKQDRSNLPFVERFRPNVLDGIMSHGETIRVLKNYLQRHDIPHLLFYGPPGTGKTSTIEAFVNELYGQEGVEFMTMNINASEERGIEIVRNKIKDFVSTDPIRAGKAGSPRYKFVILDEADAMTLDAQGMLKQVIEYFTDNARFCLICNCIKKINPAIQSRCSIFNFPPLDFVSVQKKIGAIAKEFKFTVTPDGVQTLWKLSNGDMRKVLHMLQVISINNKVIDSEKITKFKNYPTNGEMDNVYSTLLKGDLMDSNTLVKNLIKQKHYSLSDILTELTLRISKSLMDKKMDPLKGANLLTDLRDIEMNLIVTADTDIQMTSIVSVFTTD
ncbi:DNA polymerase III [Yasminevirus sp. GU-2018]|uniref:DNA polymerase III n=1 Tax=Yasminevirus sp. GU-2018 TaxID=2420051 RepID=A0A5K0U8B0_9VIRU|nr:DNA polymerase III [Yasminevirus sp. GU-2018]